MEQPNILLVTLPAQGHLNPILRLGNCLASRGLNVTLVTTTTTLQNSSFAGSVRLEFISDGLPADFNRGADIDYYMDTLSKFAPVNLLALIRSCKSTFACIISTPFVPWVADVAEEVGIPHAMLWIQPCTLYQIYNRYYNRLDEFPTESNVNMSVNLPGLPVFSAEELPSFVLPINKSRSFNDILNKVLHNMHKVKWVLGNTFMELEKNVIASLSDAGCEFRPVGPLVLSKITGKEEVEEDVGFDLSKAGDEGKCIEWLNKQRVSSVVYISFGTIQSLSEKEIQSIATGLKSINRPFLWVIRSTINQGLQEFKCLDGVNEQGLIVSWSPQTKVLSHPSVGCFLSHCGWNSVLESLVFGVPIIACPQRSDQPANAKLVTDVWRVGVKLKKGVVSGEEVGRSVEEVMSGPRSEEFRKNALKLKVVALEALADGGSSNNNIKMFVDEVISSSCSTYSKQK